MKILRVRHEVILAAAGNENAARFYIALRMRCTTPHPDGKDRLAERFSLDDLRKVEAELGRRDGIKNLERLIKMGWVRDGGNDWYYFTSQDKIAKQHLAYIGGNQTVSTKTVDVEFSRLCGKVVLVRSYFYSLILASTSESNTFSRSTIHKLTGRTKKTQRKYEKAEGISHDTNLGIVGEDNIKPTKAPYIVIKDEEGVLGEQGATKLAYQMANTYHVDKSVVNTQRVRLHRAMPEDPQQHRLYFDKSSRELAIMLGERSNDVVYTLLACGQQETESGVRYGCNVHVHYIPRKISSHLKHKGQKPAVPTRVA